MTVLQRERDQELSLSAIPVDKEPTAGYVLEATKNSLSAKGKGFTLKNPNALI